ncbi:hypothetical protein [Pedobacter heparinus]|uniref:Uncharacterized protein n=1 Tax=Pedobacter heparinus (strain ATCC 13125 / DSM 2366 / CIP 104194 / JCM 7457 / NBRC 12017 / NCIMB 9290 / NRRL B-14731 / HIM 762-3) TaxID=485917 RepID=C6Y1J5_PEDHD|nr:hypothetical protein [Pedobacter heparinus]ACU02971.1 hypothetical protein Phep_0749 [Pedobacter heparinus DSM 2366]
MDKIIRKLMMAAACLLLAASADGQEYRNDTLRFDMDLDRRLDTVIFDKAKGIIVCKLSTQAFREIKSMKLIFDGRQSGIEKKGNGFTYTVPHMRAGYHCDFAYSKALKKVQIIGMNRYEFGPANNDGSGESSVNLLTDSYSGIWNYYDMENSRLVEMPTIKRKMVLPKTYLETFDDKIINQYISRCVKLFEKEKADRIGQRKTANFKHSFSDASGKNMVSVKVYNPCDLAAPPWDADKNFIEASLVNRKNTLAVRYDNPAPEMSLIFYDHKEISVQTINGINAVFIPFYYCGNSEDHDKAVSYLIFYNGRSYARHLAYACTKTGCKLQQEQKTIKGLPVALSKHLIKYSNSRHKNKRSFHQD